MSLKSMDFGYALLLALFKLTVSQAHAIEFLLERLHSQEYFFVLHGDLLKGFALSLHLQACASVVREDVLLFHLKGADTLLGSALSIGKLLGMSAEVFISLGDLTELPVNEGVFSREGLDIFDQRTTLGVFSRCKLSFIVELLASMCKLLPQSFDLVFSLKEASLDRVFFARDNGHLVLHVREIAGLFLQLPATLGKLFSFLIKFLLNLIFSRIEQLNRAP